MPRLYFLSDRRPFKRDLYYWVMSLWILATPMTINTYVECSTGIGAMVSIEFGQVTLHFHPRYLYYTEMSISDNENHFLWGYSYYLLPKIDYSPGLEVSIPSWIFACFFALCYRRADSIFKRIASNPSWCRRCEYDLSYNVSGLCPECGLDCNLRRRTPFLIWIAKNLLTTTTKGCSYWRASLIQVFAAIIYILCFAFLARSLTRYMKPKSWCESDFLESLSCIELSIGVLIVATGAWVLTRVVLISVFLKRPFDRP